MIHIFVKIQAKEGSEDTLKAGVRDLVAATKNEDGCVAYDAYVSNSDPSVIRFAEVWQDEASVGAHQQAPHFLKFFELSSTLLAGPPEIDMVSVL